MVSHLKKSSINFRKVMNIWVDGGKTKHGEVCIYTEEGEINIGIEKNCTINLLEYKAMLRGLELAQDGDVIYSDSKLVIYQLMGWWKINHQHLQDINDKCRKILQEKQVRFFWIPRHKNKAGQLLALKKNKKKRWNTSNKKFIR